MEGTRAISIALALTIVPLAAMAAGADPAAECLAADSAAFFEVHEKGSLAGAEGWTASVGYTLDRLPMTPTLLAVKGDAVCDLTNGIAAFLGPAASPATAEAALETALLAVGAIYVDVFPDPVLLPAMGLDAEAPVVKAVPGGYVAEFTAWTERNGAVTRFTVTLDGDVDASFVVLDDVVGPFVGHPEGWRLMRGDTEAVLSGEAFLDAATVIMGTNVDGTQWRVTYFPERYSSPEEALYHAEMHLDGATAAYTEAHGWGFSSADPDRIMDLTLDGCDCIYAGYQANIHMFPRANDILPLLPGLQYRNEQDVAQLIAGHELFHHFQYGIQQWRMGNWMTEGQARFSETVHVPDATFLPTTLVYWPNANGMNGFLANTNAAINAHTYDWSIVWGYLQAHNGGMAFIKAALEESRTGGTNANTDGVNAINRALERFPDRTHATFADAYADFAEAIHTKEGFVWGKTDGTQVHDWATYFRDPVRITVNGASQQTIQTWGIVSVHAAPTQAGGPVAALVADDANTYSRLVTRDTGGAWTSKDLLPAAATEGVADGVVLLMRASHPYGPLPLAGTPLADTPAGALDPVAVPQQGKYVIAIAK